MIDQKIYVLGDDDMVIMFGIIGVKGIIVNNREDLITTFEELITDNSVGMVIITLNITKEQIEYFYDFKLNNKRPFVFVTPDIFREEGEREVFLKQYEDILETLSKT
jgi:vacuolar-type H+-ATPase subunit F/Vma7